MKIQSPPTYNPVDRWKILEKVLKSIEDNPKFKEFLYIQSEGKYVHWDKFRRIPLPFDDISHQEAWIFIDYLRGLSKQVILLGEHTFSFNLPKILLKKLHILDLHFGGTLKSTFKNSDINTNFYLHSSLIEEAIRSSQVEGASTTRKVAKEMIETGRKPLTIDERMILNNYKAMEYIIRHENEVLSEDHILTLHGILTDGTLEDENEVGAYRHSDDVLVVDTVTNETLHTPYEAKKIPKIMEDFISFFNVRHYEGETFIHPILVGIMIHFFIGWIHPFVDGNGRTARGLFYWYLVKNNYWMVEHISISRSIKRSTTDYKNAYLYSETDKNNITYFLNYNLDCLIQGLDDFKVYISRKQEKEKFLKTLQHKKNITVRQSEIFMFLKKKTGIIFTVRQIAEIFSISKNMARIDLEVLVQNGSILKKHINKKSFGYISN
ncbi:transposase [Candidatus Gracilibacteria bacterium]|nr:MAG: transposase [Candidatus Gracilibacteria bacterium]